MDFQYKHLVILLFASLVQGIDIDSSPFIHTAEEVELATQFTEEPILHDPPKNSNFTAHIIFIVITSVEAFKKRIIQRNAFLQGMEFEIVNNVYHDYFFVTGLPDSSTRNLPDETSSENSTETENATHADTTHVDTNHGQLNRLFNQELKSSSDIIQGNFIDSPLNNTLKVITALSWLRTVTTLHNWLHWERYVIIMEDEATLNFLGLHAMIHKAPFYSTLSIYCRTKSDLTVDRDIDGQEYIPTSLFRAKTYPTFCSEGVIMMTSDVINELVSSIVDNQAKPVVKDFGLFLTGIAAPQTPAQVLDSDWFTYKYANCSETDWSNLIALNGCDSDPDQQSDDTTNHTLKNIQDSLDLIAFFQGFHAKKLNSLISNLMKLQTKKQGVESKKKDENSKKYRNDKQAYMTVEENVMSDSQWINFLWLTVIVIVLFLLFLEKKENHRLVRQHIA